MKFEMLLILPVRARPVPSAHLLPGPYARYGLAFLYAPHSAANPVVAVGNGQAVGRIARRLERVDVGKCSEVVELNGGR
jgi:hypothetical protein